MLTLSGSIFAQQPESHWPGFDYHAFEMQGALYASLMIDGVPVDVDSLNWDQMEVAAFVGDELRMTGMFLTDEYVLEYGELFPTLNGEPIYYTDPGEVVSFKMFNHATGEEYGQCQVLIYEGDEVTILTGEEHWEGLDDMEHPLMLNFTTTATVAQTIALSAGWNWVSFNVETTLADLEAAIDAVAVPGDRPVIKSQSKGQVQKNAAGTSWNGRLSALDMSQMYKIQIGADCEIAVQGMPIDPAELPITIKNGANWIAFPLSETMTVINAFSGYDATTGDVVKGLGVGQANKTATSWAGRLKNLDPGKGYIYNSKATETKTLFFPSPAK